MGPMNFYVNNLDIIVFVICLLNALLLFTGMGRFAIYNALDSVLYLFFPKISLKYNYRKFYPNFVKRSNGEIYPTFQTSRDEYYPEAGPFHQRAGDFFLRFPFLTLTVFMMLAPFMVGVFGPYFQEVMRFLHERYPSVPMHVIQPSVSPLFRLFALLFFLPFSSIHTTQISLYALVVFPFAVLFKFLGFAYRYVKIFVPAVCFSCLFALLFFLEVLLIYVGFLPMFHQGLTPFIESAPGLKQFIFWYPIKFKIFADLILAPLVIVVPLVTTIGSYILAKHDEEKDDETNFIVLFYKTGISYLYGPLLGAFFPKLKSESREVRNQRKINEILVIGMYLESLVCVVGTAFAYLTVAKTAHISPSGIVMGILVLLLFVPLIVFSSSGFQSFFLDTAIKYWSNLRKILVVRGDEVRS
jgi:hypothetical protein